MKRIFLYIISTLSLIQSLRSQSDSIKNPVQLSGYTETYYIYDFSNPDSHNRPGFVYSHNRHNEINLNIGFIQADYNADRIRGKFAIMAGTYSNANLAAEPGVLRNIFEANSGVKISKNKNLWIDAGIFASHIGFESAIGANCWNMTRSILADNSPYFESGVKVSFTSENEKWFLSGLVLNGWQRIQRVPGNQTPAFGHQITFKPNSKITLNSSSFVGSDSPDSTMRMRYFHNFYGQFQFTNKFGCTVGFDVGTQQISRSSTQYDTWYSPVLIFRLTPSEKLALCVRGEYYSDEKQVIISTGTPNGFQTFGYSANIDIRIMERVLWRLEGRAFSSQKDNIFLDDKNQPIRTNVFIGTSLSIGF